MNTTDTQTMTDQTAALDELLAGERFDNGSANFDGAPSPLVLDDASAGEPFDVETHEIAPSVLYPIFDGGPNPTPSRWAVEATESTSTVTPVLSAEFINESLRNVRGPFNAKKKRGAEFKGARSRLDKRADQAVRDFRAAHLSELSDEQALSISLGITGLAGDSLRGFTYLDASEE